MNKEYELVVFGNKDSLEIALKREFDKLKGAVFCYNSKAGYFEWPNQDRKYFMRLTDREEAFKVSGMCFNKITLDISLGDIEVVHYLLTRLRAIQPAKRGADK